MRPGRVAYARTRRPATTWEAGGPRPELEKIGEHPVAYVWCRLARDRQLPGEYLTELAFPLPRFLSAVRRIARRFWYVTLRQYADEDYREKPGEQFTIPSSITGAGTGGRSDQGRTGVGPRAS